MCIRDRNLIISTGKGEIKPSENWLGSYSPNEKIRESGLWLVNELYKQSLNDEEFKKLKNLVEGK